MATERLAEKIGSVYSAVIHHRFPYVEYAEIRHLFLSPSAW